jgi:hypothetical protein
VIMLSQPHVVAEVILSAIEHINSTNIYRVHRHEIVLPERRSTTDPRGCPSYDRATRRPTWGDDYLSTHEGDRFVESMRYVREAEEALSNPRFSTLRVGRRARRIRCAGHTMVVGTGPYAIADSCGTRSRTQPDPDLRHPHGYRPGGEPTGSTRIRVPSLSTGAGSAAAGVISGAN